jgi:hypothetical protein
MLYILVIWKPPRWLFDRWLKRVRASSEPQQLYPVRAGLLRALYMIKRGIDHLRHLDFSTIPGMAGYFVWKVGLVTFWWEKVIPKMEKPARQIRNRKETVAPQVEVIKFISSSEKS